MTATRSKDHGGHSNFPAGLAGDRQKAVCRPSGKAPATRKPAPNGAGGVAGVRRVQCKADSENHCGALLGGPCTAHASGMGSAGAPRGPTAPVPAILVLAVSGWREGGRNPHGGAASSAAMADSLGQGKTGGKPGSPFLTAALAPRSE
ncbi:hypothetical protein NDU88_000728 [Pleurodeles waltl]|uniref:Uncharacterized protein n=1 Tax=Pleurodeles waltl TaxID=8319 RepID=A0AAV7TGQ1_PLEWA|nr:hypothetical protein NDU88_000728 [Pleurodeles waltl]